MYRNYIFDFYGTLADIRTDEENPQLWEKMSEIYGALGAPYEAEELKRAFRRMEQEEIKRLQGERRKEPEDEKTCRPEANRAGTDRSEMCQAEKDSAGTDRPEIDQAEAENTEPDLTKVFALLYQEKKAICDPGQARMTAITFRALSRKFLRLYDGVEELLGELRGRGRGVYLLSNAQTDFTRPEIEMLGLTSYFDGIFLSSEQGCKKPSPVFFRSLLDRYGLKPSESIMMGNDEAADIAGARSVGMDTLYIHTDISPEEYGRVPATYRVMDGNFRKAAQLLLDADEKCKEEEYAEKIWTTDRI